MAVNAEQISVGTTPVELSSVATTDRAVGQHVIVKNRGLSAVYVGGADVTTSGFELSAGEAISADLGSRDRLYAIAASTPQVVHVLRAGV